MAGSLIKIDEEIVTSAVASVTLGGANWDSSYDVYVVKVNNVVPDTDSQNFRMRFLASSSEDISANYDFAAKQFRTSTTFGNTATTNQTSFDRLTTLGTATGEQANSIFYLFNMNNASEYSFMTCEMSVFSNSAQLQGKQGGGVLTVAQATNGVSFFPASGNIVSGTFTLYGLKK